MEGWTLSEGTVEGPRWVSAADAADAAGVTPDTVRRWAERGLIASQRSRGLIGEQVMVRLEEVRDQSRAATFERPVEEDPLMTTDPHLPGTELAPILKAVPELMSQLTAATDRAARAEMKVEFLSQQLEALRDWVRQVELLPGGPAQAGDAARREDPGLGWEPLEQETPPDPSRLFPDAEEPRLEQEARSARPQRLPDAEEARGGDPLAESRERHLAESRERHPSGAHRRPEPARVRGPADLWAAEETPAARVPELPRQDKPRRKARSSYEDGDLYPSDELWPPRRRWWRLRKR